MDRARDLTAEAPAGVATVEAPIAAGLTPLVRAPLNPREALSLQGQIGNHAVANLLDGRPRPAPPPLPSPVPRTGDPILGRALADCARARRVARQEEGETEDDSLIPDWLMDGIQSAVSSIPGYTVLTAIIGKDPLTGEPARVSREELVEQLLAYGPFAAAVGPVLSAVEVIDDVIALVTDGLAAHNLTVARIERDIGAAWDEVSVLEGIDGNVAIVQRYVDAVLADVGAFVESIVDRVIELVREAAADVAEPLLATPEIEPIWSLAKKVLHYDPLRGEAVDAPTVEILADFLRLIGEEERLAQMQERGTLQEAADWLDTQAATFAGLLTQLRTLFTNAWEAIQPENLPNLIENLEALAGDAFDLVRGVGDFATTVIGKVLELVKESLLGWLSDYAADVPGFRLLTVVLGQNPFTGAAVERDAENLIGGFIALLPGGEATYQQLAESGVIGQAGQRIESEMSRLGISVELITNTFTGIWDSLTLDDLIDPIAAFERIVDQFGEPLSRLFEFVSTVIEVVVGLILRLMNFPSDLLERILANLMRSIEDIQRDPIAFLTNMLEALKTGFTAFLGNLVGYLTQGLTDWLFRGLGKLGIQIPTDLSPQSILDLILQVLGVTVDRLWEKLANHLGPERVEMLRGAVDRLTGIWEFVKDVQERGLAAIWDYVSDQLGALWDTLVDMAKDWIMSTIVERVTAKLLSMLDPTGIMAVVNSMVAFFNAIQSAIEYLRDILEIVDDYVTSFAEVAAGNIASGAGKVERGLANAIPVAIGFLANQVGISDVPEKIVELIERLRELIDEALDWLVEKAVSLGQSALAALGGEGAEDDQDDQDVPSTGDPQHDAAVSAGLAAVRQEEQQYVQNGEIAREDATKVAETVKANHPIFSVLHIIDGGDSWDYEWAASPPHTLQTPAKKKGATSAGNPGVPAQGLGRVGKHGSKPPSLRTGHEIHWIESEHIIPFAVGKRLWEMLNFVVPGRGGHEDRGQTTIMIYYHAAREKTDVDNEIITAFEAKLEDADIQRLLTAARTAHEAGMPGAEQQGRQVVALIIQGLRATKDDAVERTDTAITNESALHMDGDPLTNAERRGPPGSPEPASPGSDKVSAAAEKQFDDIIDLVTQEMTAVNILTGR